MIGKYHHYNNSQRALGRSSSAASRQEMDLMMKSAKAAETATDPIEKLRHLCLSRGSNGILGLGRELRLMDADEDGVITKEEFIHGITKSGLSIGEEDLQYLFSQFDTYENGTVGINDFLVKLRPPMSPNRHSIVEQAFAKLDRSGLGIITKDDIHGIYSVDNNSRFMNGDETADMIVTKFIENFEKEGTVDGKVTLQEFISYYSGISASIEDDCYFDLMMRQAYRL